MADLDAPNLWAPSTSGDLTGPLRPLTNSNPLRNTRPLSSTGPLSNSIVPRLPTSQRRPNPPPPPPHNAGMRRFCKPLKPRLFVDMEILMSIVQRSVQACQEVSCKDLTNHQLAREGSVNYLLSQPVKQSEAIINLGSCIHVMCLTPRRGSNFLPGSSAEAALVRYPGCGRLPMLPPAWMDT